MPRETSTAMTVNRDVGYFVASGGGRGAFVQFGVALPANVVVTLVRVTSKLCFTPGTYTGGAAVETGVWGHAIQYGLNGNAPTAWNASQQDASIIAYDSADPDAVARVFWQPNTATAEVDSALSRTLEFRGQFHTTTQTEFYYRPYDITQAANTFLVNFGWQLWWAS